MREGGDTHTQSPHFMRRETLPMPMTHESTQSQVAASACATNDPAMVARAKAGARACLRTRTSLLTQWFILLAPASILSVFVQFAGEKKAEEHVLLPNQPTKFESIWRSLPDCPVDLRPPVGI